MGIAVVQPANSSLMKMMNDTLIHYHKYSYQINLPNENFSLILCACVSVCVLKWNVPKYVGIWAKNDEFERVLCVNMSIIIVHSLKCKVLLYMFEKTRKTDQSSLLCPFCLCFPCFLTISHLRILRTFQMKTKLHFILLCKIFFRI